MGTLRIIPVIPQITPHKDSASMVTNALRFIELPTSLGSKTLPIITCMVPTVTRVRMAGVISGN